MSAFSDKEFGAVPADHSVGFSNTQPDLSACLATTMNSGRRIVVVKNDHVIGACLPITDIFVPGLSERFLGSPILTLGQIRDENSSVCEFLEAGHNIWVIHDDDIEVTPVAYIACEETLNILKRAIMNERSTLRLAADNGLSLD